MEKDYLTIDEAAIKLNVSQKTIRRYINNGKISAQKIGGVWRIFEESLQAYGNSCSNNHDPQASKDDFCVYMDSEYYESEDIIQMCTIIDYYVQEHQTKALLQDVMEVVAEESLKNKSSRFNYVYDHSLNKMRLIFWGLPSFIERIAIKLKKYERVENNV